MSETIGISLLIVLAAGSALIAVSIARRKDYGEAVILAALVGLGALVVFASWLAFA